MTGEGKKAFTLAEVLITLGIIGVVAAMTIPTLVANYNAKQWNTAATVFDRKLEEALKTMNTQSTLAGHTTTESFVEELSKHFKTNKICKNDKLLDCFSDVVYWGGGDATPEEVDMSIIKTAKNFGQTDWDTNIVGVQFANGTSAMIAYNPTNSCTQDPYSNQVTGGDCLAILYDTSGEKNPNTSAKDLRSNGNVTKLGKGCAFEINGTCYATAPFIPTPITYTECAGENATSPFTATTASAYAQSFGIQDCYERTDYWAGAVIQCGGVDKLPTPAQLAELAKYMYGMNVGTGGTGADCPLDSNGNKTKCRDDAKIPFNLTTNDSTFSIWSNFERSSIYARKFEFEETEVSIVSSSRNMSDIMAICLGDD